ncbi:hypothetical protein NLJ89_g6798 [Agrocybe chaxingu]|uniref:UBC core domain-containing protein n=1 Tax=Agrocybe chaxingu TaxID=84603 RepID=A0A9W8JVS3_9AGAR|nr:hypothetical protein NLJ89_g6798 [Agrocybe chaxingu]
MSSQTSRRLLARLQQDLGELQDNPYPGVDVFTDDANLRKLCLVLTPPSGPWKDLTLHFSVFLPQDWPTSPPNVQSSVDGIQHPNLFGSYICCDLIKPHYASHGGYTGGYTPALTLRGLFLQFLTFFSSTKIEQEYGGHIHIGEHVTTVYRWDSPFPDQRFPKESGCDHLFSCQCVKDHTTMANTWESSSAPEVDVPASHGQLFHKVKYLSEHQAMHKVGHLNPRWTSTFELISKWTCNFCPYGSPSLPHHRRPSTVIARHKAPTPITLTQSLSECKLSILNDDVLAELASYLASETMVALSLAYPRFRQIVASFHLLLRSELKCFFLRIPLSTSILGIGIAVDLNARSLSSDFDWLSLEAFETFKIRKSIQKRPFDHFLPLAFNRVHFSKSKAEIWKRLGAIDKAFCDAEFALYRRTKRKPTRRAGPPAKPYHTVEVLYRMMNNIVVSLMHSCDGTVESTGRRSQEPSLLYASEKAVVSYCLLLHLLMCLSRSTPAILSDATNKLRAFIDEPGERLKAKTPDMGELIVVVILVLVMPQIDTKRPITWDAIRGKFLEEAIIRNVRWVLQTSPELELLEQGASDYRLETTFANSKTSLRLIMFQVSFLSIFLETYASDITFLDDNYGFADKDLPERMVKEIKEIYKVGTWPQFFAKVRFGKQLDKGTFSEMLRKTVLESGRRRYHAPLNRDAPHALRLGHKRAENDAGWAALKYTHFLPK